MIPVIFAAEASRVICCSRPEKLAVMILVPAAIADTIPLFPGVFETFKAEFEDDVKTLSSLTSLMSPPP